MNKKLICSVVAGLLVAVSPAWGFKIGSSPIHENITADALGSKSIVIYYSDGTRATVKNGFSEYVQEENTENDENGIWLGELHFDDSRLEESSANIFKFLNAAVKAFKTGDYSTGGEWWASASSESTVQSNIGMAMHTLQDFFAHSTWVETNIELCTRHFL